MPKTSKAEVYSARLNPINPHEAKAIEIIEYWKAEGFNFKQIVTDYILRCGGFTPEMFDADPPQQNKAVLEKMEQLLKQFQDDLVTHLQKNRGTGPIKPEEIEGEISSFSKNFAASYKQRQKQGLGEDDE